LRRSEVRGCWRARRGRSSHGASARRHLERAEIAFAVENAVGERLLLTQQMQDRMFDAMANDPKFGVLPTACPAF